ncbi:MAG: PSD1 and planctomycete cytochrome C domain-containing protein [Pirellulales bacterium]
MRAALTFCLILLIHTTAFAEPPSSDDGKQVDFVKQVRPILRKHCYSCHSDDEQESGLRLDQKQNAFAGGDNGVAIVPGNAAKSRLILALTDEDEDIGIMPPEGEGKPLDAAEIAILKSWVNSGANWPDGIDDPSRSNHWAFQSVESPAVPTVKLQARVRNPIDNFVFAQLESKNLAPADEADRLTLMRRLHLDLTGLPPTMDEINQYVSDKQPGAYERLVDRILKSPHYGERWARHWLDLARYADSDGYEKDRPRPHAWRYRDWVINALNNDMPFDQFTIEQIAGDLLPDATTDQQTATGFHRNTLHNTEGGADQEEDRVKKTVDRTNTTGTTWLGLTVGCAQCHSHKYDPISQREYYQLYGFFNNMYRSDVVAPLPAELKQIEKLTAKLKEVEKTLAEFKKNNGNQLESWAKTLTQSPATWASLKPVTAESKHASILDVAEDGAVFVTGENKFSDVYTLNFTPADSKISAIRLEVLPHDKLVSKGPGRANNGNFVLDYISARLISDDKDQKPIELKLESAQSDFAQKGWEPTHALKQNDKKGWAVSPQIGKRHLAVFSFAEPIAIPEGYQLQITLDQTYEGSFAHNLGHFRIATSSSELPIPLDSISQAILDIAKLPIKKRTADQKKQLKTEFDKSNPETKKLEDAVAAAKKTLTDYRNKGSKVRSVKLAERETKIHIRGNFLEKGEAVQRNTPAVLPDIELGESEKPRLTYARWLVSKENPLTARVTVNRIWQRHFGRGIVSTVDDFGTQGELPSHPQLLDWLADDFVQHNWSLKHLHKRIVTSSIYRQSSAIRAELAAIDPDNELLARFSRRRVEAEVVRDISLSVAGLMSAKVGGPSVKPPQPDGVSFLTYNNSAKWVVSKGEDRNRRGLYTFFQRTSPYPMLMTFDSPDSNEVCAARNRSNTPLQALTLLNDKVFFECAQTLAVRVTSEVPAQASDELTTAARIGHLMQLCLAREPDPSEATALHQLFLSQKKLLETNPEATLAITGSDAKQTPNPNLAAWVITARAVMNLDEFITLE